MTKLAALFVIICLMVGINEFAKGFKGRFRRIPEIRNETMMNPCDTKKNPLTCKSKQPPSKSSKSGLGSISDLEMGYYRVLFQQSNGEDDRIELLKKEWFEGKDVLDVGCNVGLFALTIAKKFEPKSVMGIDRSKKLIKSAERNCKVYRRFAEKSKINLPKKIHFIQGDYVLVDKSTLKTIKPEYDIITCLSVTMWVQLQYGDSGLKSVFQRIYRNLRPGGKLLLEYYTWNFYERHVKQNETILEQIHFRPDDFQSYLLNKVGFSKVEILDYNSIFYTRDKRPLLLFTKSG